MRRLAAVFLLTLVPFLAHAQVPLQSGPTVGGRAVMYAPSGSSVSGAPAYIQDAGPSGGWLLGQGINEFLQVNRFPGNGPLGSHNCAYDNASPTLAQYFLCFDANIGGVGLISYGALGSGVASQLNFNINGVTYPFPGNSGNVSGPGSGVQVRDLAAFNSTPSGTLLKNTGPAQLRDTHTAAVTQSFSSLMAMSDGVTTVDSLVGANVNGQTLAGVVNVVNGSVLTNLAGVAGYAIDNAPGVASGGVNALALYGWGQTTVNNAWLWGGNTIINSKAAQTGVHLYGFEIDVNSLNAGDTDIGLQISGASTATPSSSVGVVITPLGSGIPWGTAYFTQPGAATNAAVFGPVSASGTSINSQAQNFQIFDAGGVLRNWIIQGSPTALNFSSTITGTPSFQFNGGLVITGGSTRTFVMNNNTIASNNAGAVVLVPDATATTLQVGNSTTAVTILGPLNILGLTSYGGAGAESKCVAVDASGNVLLKNTGTC